MTNASSVTRNATRHGCIAAADAIPTIQLVVVVLREAAGCNPIAVAIIEGQEDFRPQKPDTVAKSLAIGNPADGYFVIDVVNESGGSAASATDPEILDAVRLLARTEGIFTEPAGGTTLAAAIRLIESGAIPADESICISITGNGLKTAEAFEGLFEEPDRERAGVPGDDDRHGRGVRLDGVHGQGGRSRRRLTRAVRFVPLCSDRDPAALRH